ncbi:MAG TPA: Xaa-Pro peptidase family protein [Anaerolineae bacterium]|jgi:Xaa-Pro aminopeptidase|nr:Xaa-Pro peptidase family protein [Anaerolineae bacterium]
MKVDYQRRLASLRERIKAAEIDALIVSEPHNIFYLSGSNGGFTGAKVRLVIDANTSTLIIDYRYFDEALEMAVADRIIGWEKPSLSEVVDIVRDYGAVKIGFESTHITVKQYEQMVKEFEGIQLVGVSGLVEPLREVKDDYEIQEIGEAAAIGDAAFEHILTYIKPGVSELELVIEIEFFMRRRGAEKPSFDTIVASGVHSAVPHATPTTKRVKAGDFVKLDFGAVIGGYHSDMTRTVVVGEASQKQRELYAKVREAQKVALDAVTPGKTGKEIDNVARDIISDAGYGENFTHNLGHGVGLNVHELPVLGAGGETELKKNMVVTVEPGIYVSGFGGVRIEDLVVVTETGYRILTHSTKELLEL